MAVLNNKRSVMTLYSDSNDIYSHRVRIVLAEKGVAVDILPVNSDNLPEDLVDLNPYNTIPTLVDRELVLYQSRIIMDYLDERFPHPPLLPVYPVARAKSRLLMYRVEHDWYRLFHQIENGETQAQQDEARQLFQDSLQSVAPIFSEHDYFLSDDYSLVDCSIAPLLWRLPSLKVNLGAATKAINAYANRIFERETFQASLTEAERELRHGS